MAERFEYIFSYGSNLMLDRIRLRLREVTVAGVYCLNAYQLRFNKRGMDGSAKANLVFTGRREDHVWGVIHKIHATRREMLDRIEGVGRGYDHHLVSAELDGKPMNVLAYMATDPHYLSEDAPFCWYHQYVLKGALENEFPETYIDRIRRIAYRDDPDPVRSAQHWKVLQTRNGV